MLKHLCAPDTQSSATTLWGTITVPIVQVWKSRLREAALPTKGYPAYYESGAGI